MRRILALCTALCAHGVAWAAPSTLGGDLGQSQVRANGSTAQSARVIGNIEADRLNVMDFGAFNDCVSRPLSTLYSTLAAAQIKYPAATALTQEVNSAAFAQAEGVAASRVNTVTTYWTALYPTIYAPAGCYILNGFTLQPAMSLMGDGNGTLLKLANGANISVITVAPDNPVHATTNPGFVQHMHATISNLTIDGNSGAQTAGSTSHGIQISDMPSGGTYYYGSSARIINVNIYGVLSDSVYIGKARNLGYIDNLLTQYAGNDGLEFNSAADWLVTNFSVGDAQADGVRMYASSSTSFENCAIYNNAHNGFNGDTNGAHIQFANCTIGANGQNNIAWVNARSAAGQGSDLQLSNVMLAEASLQAAGSFSQIYAQNFNHIQLNGVWIEPSNGNQTGYVLQGDNTGFFDIGNLTYDTGGSGVVPAYTIAPYSGATQVRGTANGSMFGMSSIGLGTTSPAQPLDIEGTTFNSPALQLGVNGTEYATLGGASVAGAFSNQSAIGDTVLRATNDLILSARNGGGAIKFTTGAADTVKAQFTNSGNLGLGTVGYRTVLSVGTQAGSTGIAAEYNGVDILMTEDSSSNAGRIQTFSGGSGATLGTTPYLTQINPLGGNVAIGTTASSYSLTVSATNTAEAGNVIASFQNSANSPRINLVDETSGGLPPGITGGSSGYGFGLYAAGNSPIILFQGGVDRMRVEASGDIRLNAGSALATNATAGFVHLPYLAGTPTGTPGNTAIACAYNTTSNNLDCYNGSGWFHVALTAGAN